MQEINNSNNPFPGLRPFESSETHLFFGRDGQSEELLRRLKRTRFLAVVGTSGSGKSSLVRAGLLPALQGGLMASAGSDWRIAITRPGNDPIGNLARSLASPELLGSRGGDNDDKSIHMQAILAETTLRRSSLGLVELVSRARTKLDGRGQPLVNDYENLLVVVDQFEELFRFKQLIEAENSQEDAAAFVKLLLEAVRQPEEKIYVVLTMRSDFLGDCSQFWELPEAINNGQYLIPRMTRDERREAITGPVAVGQGAISDPLVNQLLNDVGDNPDQLPILQHALMRTWDHWFSRRLNGELMDIKDYDDIGGMAEALSRHADEAYEELSAAQKLIAEKMFKGLTEKGADNREIRRPMAVREICELTGADEATVISVVEVFRRKGRSFLMPPPTDALTGAPVPLTGESLIDISHESLIRNWERLKKWVDEESRLARIYRRLAETAVIHREGGAGLWRGPDLQVALKWRESDRPNHVWARRYHPDFKNAMTFLDKSRRRRRLALLFYCILLLAILAMLSGMVWYRQRGLVAEARRDTDAVRQQEEIKRQQERVAEQLATQQKVAQLGLERQQEVARLELQRQQEISALKNTQAEERTKLAEAGRKEAESQRKEAERQRTIAEDKTKEAATQRDLAIANGKKLEEQVAKTTLALDDAKRQRDEAERQRNEAQRQRELAEAARDKEIQARADEKIANEKASNAEQQSKEAGNKLQATILEGLKPEAAELAVKLINEAKAIGIEVRLISGYRSTKDQSALYGQGRTRPGMVVTFARVSTHNTGLAFDVAVVKNGKVLFDGPDFETLGSLGEKLGLIWGGRFRLKDPPHFQTIGAQDALKKLSAELKEN